MREIKISLETAQRWYNGQDSELKELAVQTYPELVKKELPKRWRGLWKIEGWIVDDYSSIEDATLCNTTSNNKNIFAKKEQAEASIALAQLSQLLAVYNDGWVPDWNDSITKYHIRFSRYEPEVYECFYVQHFLQFKTKEIAELFLKNFKDLILTAKPLL